MNFKSIKITISFICVTLLANSQSYIGIQQSNYAGIMGADIQPASIADSRYIFDMNLLSFNFFAYNNIVLFDNNRVKKAVGNIWSQIFKDGKSPWGNSENQELFTNVFRVKNPNNRLLGMHLNTQIDGLSFMVSFKEKYAIGFSAKFRSIFNIDDISNRTADALLEDVLGLNTFDEKPILTTLTGVEFIENQKFSHQSLTWAEFGINYAQVVYDTKEHFIKLGGELKLLRGFSSTYFKSSDKATLVIKNNELKGMFGSFERGFSDGYKSNFTQSPSAWGGGFDFGGVYEWRPNWKEYKYEMDGKTDLWRKDKNKYKIRAGISFLDIGGINFKKDPNKYNFSVSFEDFINPLVDTLKPIIDANDNGKFVMQLPTSMSLQFDYNIWKWFYINVTGLVNLHNSKTTTAVRIPHQIVVTPRFDYAWAGISVPLSYNEFSGFKAGLGLRLGPVVIGVGDLKPLFNVGEIRGAEVYAGVRIPILYSKPKDVDGDKISDKLDLCKERPGVWSFQGCPDTDKDGIQDIEDKCPNIPGLKKFKGCPDTDKDGVEDSKDECPKTNGLKILNGCPDSDNDGIADRNDVCPKIFGLKQFKGCPDTDNDGIEDRLDKCINTPGPKESNGCPDTDADGVFDDVDKCINERGSKENDGCPYSDRDNDGIKDAEDICPDLAGVLANKGCPEIENEVKEILKLAFEDLEFHTSKATIKEVSKESLNKLAKILIKRPNLKLQIAGHTDSDGSAKTNLLLSKKRAESVRDYLMKMANIKDKSRFKVLYFGETMPLFPNTSSKNKQKNRRVEMTILN